MKKGFLLYSFNMGMFFSMFFRVASAEMVETAVQTQGEKEGVQIVEMHESPYPQEAQLTIVLPEKGAMIMDNPVWIQLRTRGFPLGANSQLPRTRELTISDKGQSAHVIIDNEPYFAKTDPSLDPLDQDGDYYQDMIKFSVPYSLKPGRHTLRVFYARSFGEGLKGEKCFASSYFFVKSKEGGERANLSQPFLTYNEPSNTMVYRKDKPVLLDFYVHNCELAKDGYKVVVTLDGEVKRTLIRENPYYIYGLTSGSHKIRMELIDQNGQKVLGDFNDVTRTFRVQ